MSWLFTDAELLSGEYTDEIRPMTLDEAEQELQAMCEEYAEIYRLLKF